MKVDFKGNLEIVGDVSGIMEGIADAVDDNKYMDPVIRSAHDHAAHEFDVAMAATANARYLSHMYEFGTAGITRGPVKFTDPTAPGARLYTHVFFGMHGKYNVGFAFRPALQPNPQPTTEFTGVASKYLRKLSRRKYTFRQRAMVTETGMEVDIKPQRGPFLFVPFYGETPKNPLNKRGFVMYNFGKTKQPIKSTPGQTSQGTFTAFWNTWWRAQGERSMRVAVGDAIRFDIQKSLASASTASEKRMKSVYMTNVRAAAKKKRKTTEQMMITHGARRRARGQ